MRASASRELDAIVLLFRDYYNVGCVLLIKPTSIEGLTSVRVRVEQKLLLARVKKMEIPREC